MAAERFSDVMEAIQRIFFLSVDKRLANFLLEEIERNNTNVVPVTHEQIARYIGSAREVVSGRQNHSMCSARSNSPEEG